MYVVVLNLITGSLKDAPDEELVQRLVAAAREGDTLAAHRLCRMFIQRVYRAVRPLTHSYADAEDVVQDTFVQALGNLGRYHRRPSKRFVAWLMTIALNTARKQARRNRRWTPLTPAQAAALKETAGTENADSLAENLDRQRLGTALLKALDELSDRDRKIILLRYGSELNSSEIGRIVGEQPASVRKVCQRQRGLLLRRLARATGDPQPPTRIVESAP